MISSILRNVLSLSLITLGSSCASVQHKSQIYTFESDANGFNTKNFFYDNGEEVVAFDTQFTPELARQSIAFLKSKTKNPITFVVITHPNPDKFNGISEFRKLGARIVASDATVRAIPGVHAYKQYYFVKVAKMFTDETYPKLAPIDQTFSKSEGLRLRNGESINLTELNLPGVSSNQTVASIPRAKALMVGDLIHHKAHAWLEGGIVNGKATPTVDSWKAILRSLQKNFAPRTLVFGGRGEVSELGQSAEAQIRYLDAADKLVIEFVKEKGQDFGVLQKKFEAKFPDYALGYMIQYGAYGLVQSKL